MGHRPVLCPIGSHTLCRRASLAARTRLHHGLIDSVPEGPFDAATCILTLHSFEREERLRTLGETGVSWTEVEKWIASHAFTRTSLRRLRRAL